jgi:hypothetical protein
MKSSRSAVARGLSSCSLFAALAAGCGPVIGPNDGATGDAAAPEGSAPDARVACPTRNSTQSFVFARIAFVREEMGMTDVADGFNIDNRVSRLGDTLTCRAGDLTSPTGEPGIDNQLARLMPTVDQMTGGAVDGAIQAAINNGQMLVAITVSGIEDDCNDDGVDVTLQRVEGMPFVGSDMSVDPGQTFDRMRMVPISQLRGRITDRTLLTDPAMLPLPVAILDEQFTLQFYNARIRLALSPSGGDSPGIIGGAISLSEFGQVLAQIENIPESLKMQVNGGLALFADLDRNAMGKCEKISGALRIMARPAFVLE